MVTLEEVDVALEVGSSNFAGFLALLDDVPVADMTRWLGTGAIHPPIPSTSAQRPYDCRIPGVKILTPRRPYSTNISRTITVGGAGTTLTYTGTSAAPTGHSWVYVRVNSTGQGNLRRVSDHTTGPNVVTVTAAWSPALAADGTVHFLQDSHTINTVDAALTTVTRVTGAAGGAADAPDFTSAVVGRHVLFFADDSTRVITGFTADSITVDKALASALTGGFCILTGANSVETIADLTDPAKSVLQDLTFYLDQNAPVFLTGLDYCNYDSTPFQSPRVAYAAGPTINLTPELAFNLRSRLDSLYLIKMGISASMVSPFLNGQVYSPAPIVPFGDYFGWLHDSLSLDFHPSSPRALYTATVNQIANIRALLLAENKTPRWRGIFINLCDNDPADAQRVLQMRANLELLISSLRTAIGDQNVPVSLSGPSRYAGLDVQREFIYQNVLRPIAASDRSIGILDTRTSIDTGKAAAGDWIYPQDFAGDGLHYSASGQIKLGQGHAATWETIHDLLATSAASDALAIALCNRSLALIGEAPTVTALEPPAGSAHAQLCATLFESAYRVVLELRHWTFADKRVALADQRPSDRSGYRYMYELPSDCLVERAIVPPGAPDDWPGAVGSSLGNTELGSGYVTASVGGLQFASEGVHFGERRHIPFKRGLSATGEPVLYTDQADAELVYSAFVDDLRQWPPGFGKAVEHELGAGLGGAIKRDAALVERMHQRAIFFVNEASRIDSQRAPVNLARRFPFGR